MKMTCEQRKYLYFKPCLTLYPEKMLKKSDLKKSSSFEESINIYIR